MRIAKKQMIRDLSTRKRNRDESNSQSVEDIKKMKRKQGQQYKIKNMNQKFTAN